MRSRRSPTSVLVADASVLAPAVVDADGDGARIRGRFRGETIAGPDLLRLEVVSVLRRQVRTGSLTDAGAGAAIAALLDLPIVVFPTAPLLIRAWELRHNLSSYDACYVALAEAIGCPLLTADQRLAAAPGPRCPIEVV